MTIDKIIIIKRTFIFDFAFGFIQVLIRDFHISGIFFWRRWRCWFLDRVRASRRGGRRRSEAVSGNNWKFIYTHWRQWMKYTKLKKGTIYSNWLPCGGWGHNFLEQTNHCRSSHLTSYHLSSLLCLSWRQSSGPNWKTPLPLFPLLGCPAFSGSRKLKGLHWLNAQELQSDHLQLPSWSVPPTQTAVFFPLM